MIYLPFTTREIFARLIKCEAGGEGDSGMRAVASVVMNRVHVPYGEYFKVDQGNLRDVIMQPGQFDCLAESLRGIYNPQNIYNINPEQIHYDIADWALGGSGLGAIANSLWYFNPYDPNCPDYFPRNGSGVIENKINLHCFYIPTQKYAQT